MISSIRAERIRGKHTVADCCLGRLGGFSRGTALTARYLLAHRAVRFPTFARQRIPSNVADRAERLSDYNGKICKKFDPTHRPSESNVGWPLIKFQIRNVRI